jgi:hypothetical protein
MNATLIRELDECIGHVFPSLVILECLHLHLEVVLCKRLVCLEGRECITALHELHGSTVGSGLVQEGQPIAIAFRCSNWERTMDI